MDDDLNTTDQYTPAASVHWMDVTHSKPPFRADHVGSLLRPSTLKEARAKHEQGGISAAELEAIEDAAIEELITKQESLGFKLATDGELRRTFWHFDFMENLDGVERDQTSQGIQFKGGRTKAGVLKVTGKIGFPANHPFLRHFRFLRDRAKAVPKLTIPSPTVLHFRGGRKAIDPKVYPTMDEFYCDLGRAYAECTKAFAAEGCRYYQLDEVNFTYLCDPDQRQALKDRGDDPEALPMIYASLINKTIENIPADMAVTMHLCRGNFKSMWIASGGYEPVAEILFNAVNVHAYFMEWDTERAGGFEPLRLVPKDKIVVLGLVTSKSGRLESKDDLKRRLDEASKYIGLGQLCLSPQCGFASTEEGNLLTDEDQWAKLERVVEVAEEVWGSAADPA
ncbi:MAG TPA: 5-methyltetrahydropteroyltriglutamate--homocysteine S-methyltransferase [Bryobacteraceae bacterium]|nr:5-methyltetrahydropteroyltriglutamate--homocysteine S-methyltransferase [Bryobacteraceae bacterium]